MYFKTNCLCPPNVSRISWNTVRGFGTKPRVFLFRSAHSELEGPARCIVLPKQKDEAVFWILFMGRPKVRSFVEELPGLGNKTPYTLIYSDLTVTSELSWKDKFYLSIIFSQVFYMILWKYQRMFPALILVICIKYWLGIINNFIKTFYKIRLKKFSFLGSIFYIYILKYKSI